MSFTSDFFELCIEEERKKRGADVVSLPKHPCLGVNPFADISWAEKKAIKQQDSRGYENEGKKTEPFSAPTYKKQVSKRPTNSK